MNKFAFVISGLMWNSTHTYTQKKKKKKKITKQKKTLTKNLLILWNESKIKIDLMK